MVGTADRRAIGRVIAETTGAGVRGVARRDLDALGWVGEQYAARADQLAGRLGCGQRTVQRLLARWREEGLAETRRLLADEPVWALPTSKGLRAAGLPFRAWRPRLGLLAHVAAVTDVRLFVQERSPQSVWVCERDLARQKSTPDEHLADAMVVADGRRIAIEVELTVKSKTRTIAIADELVSAYDGVLYYCAPGPHRLLAELAAGGRWPSLGIRELPGREQTR